MSNGDYLETEVMTAPPQKLRLMLIEAALRYANRTLQCWQADQAEKGLDAMIRTQQIIGELLAGIKPDPDPQLAHRVAGLYVFVLRTLIIAQHGHSELRLREAMRVLEIERETWQQLCQKLAGTSG